MFEYYSRKNLMFVKSLMQKSNSRKKLEYTQKYCRKTQCFVEF